MAASYGFDISRPAATAQEAVQWLYFAYLGAVKEQNGAAMSLGRTSTFLDVYLQRDLVAGLLTETQAQELDRRPGDQAAHRPVPAHSRVRRAVLRRPDLGDGVDRRHGRGRPAAGHPDLVPDAADAVQPGPGARAEPDRAVERSTARGLQGVLRPGVDRHLGDPVRVGRADPRRLGRRRRHRLLRVGDAGRQADAVLRRQGQPGEDPAVRDQRWPRRDHRRAGRPRRLRR